ncbi:MAG: flagellar biosynthetic protein FliR [Planctomycetes bacterium]|nr:flagellar biosynthetic protein FliR [Planctomycetota bacterium]
MPWPMFEAYAKLPAFLLVLFRIGGVVLASPLFSAPVLPGQVKVLLTVAMAAAVFPLAAVHLTVPVTLGTAVTGLMGELAVGLLIGFGVSLIFLGVQLAAEIISHQSGILLGTVFNPMLDSSESILSQLYYFVALMAFVAVGGHRGLVRALLDSFATVPPLGFKMTPGLTDLLLDLLTASFELAIRASGPTVVALMLALLALGFLSRTMPQLNILTVGFPLKLVVALVVMALTMMSLEPVLLEAFEYGMDSIRGGLGLAPA